MRLTDDVNVCRCVDETNRRCERV